jgi:hypothetical protein
MTAVEWLFEQLCSEKLSWNKDSMGKLFIDLRTSNILQQAKEMEKEQIIEAYNTSFLLRDKPYSTAEKYYNETYESKTNI